MFQQKFLLQYQIIVYEKFPYTSEITKVYSVHAAPKQLFIDFRDNYYRVIPSIREYLQVTEYCKYCFRGTRIENIVSTNAVTVNSTMEWKMKKIGDFHVWTVNDTFLHCNVLQIIK